ncbi:galactose-1-phosphate uridylyltransferase [Patescibacteria group bacterium]|nr:galactose-1-phosphate uridylyltransferase [Candidatus Falkowbacteria bacterium]MBU3906205.1 galactose-1-phosphate uridylyltransferase [Patescibacteria group bacterium]MCG2697560.1 galactose-1-phosphate uridylyltransferase [Candidatus Parcubacteria bacterium]MBU4014774.1 galactose-1-phosphate uridylyltransferase [Patescibacteria group bacterium]MBU4026363.1 galactose-1-phosphate uridylyltransferase [Patescibacteria group bacterium]
MPESCKKSEIRKAYLLNKYVIITPGRLKRPRDIKEQTVIKRTMPCPFCAENIDKKNITDKISAGNNWQVLSIKNIFPAVTLDNEKAYGSQEVIVESPDHNKELADLSEREIGQVLEMYSRRTQDIAKNKKIDYILCFKNQGSKAGASIIHSHSQIFATEILPPEIHEEMGLAQNYKIKHGICPYCDIIKKEMKSKRKIFEDKNIAAFTPYASEYHYEAWIFPKRHIDNITLLNKEEAKSFAKALKKILIKLKKLDLSFNYFLHNAVSNKDQHLYLKIQPRDSVWAGVELGSGLVINSIPPEEAAKYFRE